MWKVLLADDEVVILEGLKKLIPWEGMGLEIVGDATDGETLLEQIRLLKPDIVITDVRMPRMTGTEVIESLTEEESSNIKFIFISAYQEFRYIKTAMSKGAVDYLLKPVRRKDLTEVLQKTLEQLENRSAIAMLKSSGEENRLHEIVHGLNKGYQYAKDDIYEALSKLDLDQKGKVFVGVCSGPVSDDTGEDTSFEKFQLLRFVIYNKITEFFAEGYQGFVIRKDDSCCNMIALIDENELDSFLESVSNGLIKRIEQEYQINICVGLGARVSRLEEINTCYSSAREAFDLYYFEEQEIIDSSLIEHPDLGEDGGLEHYNELCEAVYSSVAGKAPEMLEHIREVLAFIRLMHYGNRLATINLCLSFTGTFYEKLHEFNMVKGSFSEHQESMLNDMDKCPTFRQLNEFLIRYYEKILPRIYETMQNKDVSVVMKAKKYMQENYMNDVSLKDLAGMVCVSPSYFSTFFKATTGENYKTYLINIRLEEALKLVMNTDMKTYQLAEQVGYNNVRRFVDAFKRKYGMSPTEYRKLYKKD